MMELTDIKKRIGIQILFDSPTPEAALDYAITHGFAALELNMSSPVFFPENIDDNSRRVLSSSQIPILLHAPDGLSLFNLHRKSLNATVDRLCEVIELAHEVRARCVTIHLGTSYNISIGGKLVPIHEVFEGEYESALRHSLKRLSEFAKNKTFLCIENTSGSRYQLSQRVLLDSLNNGHLYLTWDIGHTNRLKGIKRDDEIGLMEKYSHLIKNCHIHDNNGGWDEHNVIGEGNIDFPFYLSRLTNVDTYFIIEVRPVERAIESYKRLIDML